MLYRPPMRSLPTTDAIYATVRSLCADTMPLRRAGAIVVFISCRQSRDKVTNDLSLKSGMQTKDRQRNESLSRAKKRRKRGEGRTTKIRPMLICYTA